MPNLEQALRSLEGRKTRQRRLVSGRRPRKRGRAGKVPRGLQTSYATLLACLIDEASKVVARVVTPQLARIYRQDAARLDTKADEIQAVIDALIEGFNPIFSDQIIERIARTAATRVGEWSATDIIEQLQAMGAKGITLSSLNITEQIDLFTRANVRLIKSVQSNLLGTIENTITRGARQGLRHEVISRQLLSKVGPDGRPGEMAKARKRMRLIARDQISKLNNELARVRHAEAGITHYIWQTARDGRERDTHAANDGKMFRYDDPPATGHPGEEINCRCVMVPVLPAVVEDAEGGRAVSRARL